MNRTQFQQLAEERKGDAEALLNAGQWSGAYYLAGYAIECGLKACIAKLTNQHDYPDKNLAQSATRIKLKSWLKSRDWNFNAGPTRAQIQSWASIG